MQGLTDSRDLFVRGLRPKEVNSGYPRLGRSGL